MPIDIFQETPKIGERGVFAHTPHSISLKRIWDLKWIPLQREDTELAGLEQREPDANNDDGTAEDDHDDRKDGDDRNDGTDEDDHDDDGDTDGYVHDHEVRMILKWK